MCINCDCCICNCPACVEMIEEEKEKYNLLSEREQLKFNLKGFPEEVIKEMLKTYDDTVKS